MVKRVSVRHRTKFIGDRSTVAKVWRFFRFCSYNYNNSVWQFIIGSMSLLEILYEAKTVFTRSAITPPKMNRCG